MISYLVRSVRSVLQNEGVCTGLFLLTVGLLFIISAPPSEPRPRSTYARPVPMTAPDTVLIYAYNGERLSLSYELGPNTDEKVVILTLDSSKVNVTELRRLIEEDRVPPRVALAQLARTGR